MRRRIRISMVLAEVLLNSCTAATQVAVQPAAETPASSAAPRTTTTMTPASPTATAAASATNAQPSAALNGTVIYNNTIDGSLHALDFATTTDVVLADPSGPNNVPPWAVAPDGRTVAVIWGTGWGPKPTATWEAQLWLVNIDGMEPRKLLDLHPLDQNDPIDGSGDLRTAIISPFFSTFMWTPDGQTIVATSAHEGQADLYAVAADGSGAQRLTDTPGIEFDPQLSPDGQYVAYASVDSFGTGAGWGNAAAWVVPVEGGAPQSLIGPVAVRPPGDANGVSTMVPTSIDVVGWTSDNSVLAQGGDNGVGRSAFFLTTPGNEPRAVVETGLISSGEYVWNQAQGSLVFANSSGNKADPSAALQRWTAQTDQIDDLGTVSGSSIYQSPDGTALLACNDNAGEPTPIQLWRNGELRDLDPAVCEQRAWAPDGRFALSGNAPRNDGTPNNPDPAAGKIFAADGTLRRELPVGAVVAGWQNDALLFWAPGNDGRWQLYQAVGNTDTPIGDPVDGSPWAPTLLAP